MKPAYLKASFISACFGTLTWLPCVRNRCPIVSNSLLYCQLQLTGNSREWGGLRKNIKTNQENLFHPTIPVFPQHWKTNTPPLHTLPFVKRARTKQSLKHRSTCPTLMVPGSTSGLSLKGVIEKNGWRHLENSQSQGNWSHVVRE